MARKQTLNGKEYTVLEEAEITYRSDHVNPDNWYAMTVRDDEDGKIYIAWYYVPEDIDTTEYNEPSDYIDWTAPHDMAEDDPLF